MIADHGMLTNGFRPFTRRTPGVTAFSTSTAGIYVSADFIDPTPKKKAGECVR
jgi:hypothetical protein